MQFLVIAYDGTDEKALDRRMASREAHLAGVQKMKAEGKVLYGVAILGAGDRMAGSVMVVDFPSRAELDAWLRAEPYVIGNVWQKIEVLPARVPPMFT